MSVSAVCQIPEFQHLCVSILFFRRQIKIIVNNIIKTTGVLDFFFFFHLSPYHYFRLNGERLVRKVYRQQSGKKGVKFL